MKKIMLLLSFWSLPVLVLAEPLEFFLGAKGGGQWAQDDNYNHSAPKGAVWGVYSGVQFTPSWSWDVGYQYNDDLYAEVTSVNVKTWLIESALRYDWYLRNDLSLYGRLGGAYWNMEKEQPSRGSLNATGFSPLTEVGVSYNLTPSLSLSAGYQYVDSIGKSNTGKYDSHAAILNLAYTFGRKVKSAPIETTRSVESIPAFENESLQSQTRVFSEKTIKGSFEFDAIKLNYSFVQSLGEVSSVLKSYPQARAVIVGHTDSIGTEAYNKRLSERRAQAVAAEIVDLGVTYEQLEWRGEGELNPISDNTTVQGRAQNRRVEVTIPNFQFKE